MSLPSRPTSSLKLPGAKSLMVPLSSKVWRTAAEAILQSSHATQMLSELSSHAVALLGHPMVRPAAEQRQTSQFEAEAAAMQRYFELYIASEGIRLEVSMEMVWRKGERRGEALRVLLLVLLTATQLRSMEPPVVAKEAIPLFLSMSYSRVPKELREHAVQSLAKAADARAVELLRAVRNFVLQLRSGGVV